MNRKVATVVFFVICVLFSRVSAQQGPSAATLHDHGAAVHFVPPAQILVLAQNASALDTEEQKVTAFLSTQGFSYDVADANGLSTLNAADYPLIIFRTASAPTGYNNGTVLSEIRDAVETAGVTLMVENYGSYLAEYLGWGTVTSIFWPPVVADKSAFVAPITAHVIFDGIPTWDPPTPPDNDDQILWEIQTATGGSGARIVSIPNEIVIECWHLLITPGWPNQPTNSTYCQSWGGCTSERSVHIDRDMTHSIRYVEKGYGRLLFSAPIGFGGTFSTDAPAVLGKAGIALKRNILLWTLQTVEPPDPPTGLTATLLSPTRVRLDWQDNTAYESRYRMQHKSGNGAWAELQTVPANTTTFTAANQQPQTEHSYRVRAENITYESSWSNIATIATGAFNPPLNLTATAYSYEEIKLEWQDATDGENGFVIDCRESGQMWAPRDSVPAGAEEYLVSGLRPNTSYEFSLHAYAGSISSAKSNVAQATTLKYLKTPTNLDGMLISETQVNLTWEDNADGESGYEIEHNDGNQAWTLMSTTSADATDYDAQGLTPNTANAFRVRAVGTNASSGYSNVYTVLTRMKPDAPKNLIARAVNHTSIRVTWERGSENEDGYEVERKAPDGAWEFLTTTGRGDGDILDENLEIATTYWYRVCAENDLGYSDWSNEDSASTMEIPIPAAPFGLRAEAAGPRSITLHWITPSPSYAESFEIEQSRTGDEGDFTHVLPDADGKARMHTVTGLDPQTAYYFRIRTVNRAGTSDYSNIATATTQGSDDPVRPQNIAARALGASQIEITWEMPDPANEDGFELQHSLTGNEGDFTSLSPEPGQDSRRYVDDGLMAKTTYWYRLRSYNSFGESSWTDTVSATTITGEIDPDLLVALDAKEQIVSQVEEFIPEGSAEIRTLRSLLGDYVRGYDESAATTLIAKWKNEEPDDAARATEAMKRFTLLEEAMRDAWGDDQATPSVPGAIDVAMQAGRAPAITTKNLIALALAWKQERDYLPAEHPWIDAAIADVILSLDDNTQILLSLMGADRDGDRSTFSDVVLKERGDVEALSPTLMLSSLEYWQERMLGKLYLAATQPLIAKYASQTELMDYDGTESDAKTKRLDYLSNLRQEVDALGNDFSDYGSICYGLDAAYAIRQTAGTEADIFLLRLKGLRPRLVAGMHDAISNAAMPVARSLYLSSPTTISGLGSIPAALDAAGSAIFDPVNSVPPINSIWGVTSRSSGKRSFAHKELSTNAEGISEDRAFLVELRGKVLDEDTDYITAQFDALRRSGQDMIAEIAALQRPLLGVPPADVYSKENDRDDYYSVLACAQLLKTRRAVLSVALADYALGPTAQKRTQLVAEIDSIIGPLNGAIDDLTNLATDAEDLITLPVLSLIDADIVRDEVSGNGRCRIRFTVQNVGGAEASSTNAAIEVLTADVAIIGERAFSLGTLQTSIPIRDSMDVDIPKDITHVAISAILETGGRSFIDRRTIPVPQSTTGIDDFPTHPASCFLHQNYPNPFNPATTIEFGIPFDGGVRLRVMDLLGREVAVLVNEDRQAGVHAVDFDGTNHPSGTYVYQLEWNGTIMTRRMTLLK